MFQDERINKECGRIYRNCIIFSLIIILVISITKMIYYIKIEHFQPLYLIVEGVLILESIIILGIGELRLISKTKDELFYFKRYSYYKKAIIVYLFIGLLGFAVALPFEFGKKIVDLSSQSTLIHLESFGFLFLVYSFKRARINFNYSFIEENNNVYAKKVAWNVLKLFVLHFVLMGFSMAINYIVTRQNYLSIFLFFLISFITLTLLYILISFVEKLSNNCIEKEKKNTALFIVGGLTFILFFAYFICLSIVILLQRDVHSVTSNLYVVMSGIANNIHLFYLPCYVWLLTFIYCSSDKNKALDCGITLFVILALLQLVVGRCSYEILQMLLNSFSITAIQKYYNPSIVIISFLTGIGRTVALSYISYHIYLKTKKYKWWFVVPILQFLSVFINLLSQYVLTQPFFVLHSCLELSVIVILIVFLHSYLENKNSVNLESF